MSARRNTIIRILAGLGIGFAEGYAIATACSWIISVASLGLFLSFCVWLIEGIVIAYTSFAMEAPLARALSDERIDAAVATTKSWFAGIRAKVAR